MKTKVLMVLAGAAMASTAFAQTSLDRDRAYAAELNADAAARTSQLAASNEGAFKLTAGNNTLYIGGLTQFRYTQDFRSDNPPVGENDDFTHGFSNANTKLRFWGNVYEQNLKYKIQGNWSDQGESGFALEDAYGWYEWESGMWVKWGQYKLPILREELIGNEHQLAVARSMTNDAFGQGWSQGVELGYQADAFRIMGDFSDGWRTANTDFNSPAEADFALTVRAEFQGGNDWTRWDDFTSWRGAEGAFLVGAAFHWETAGSTGDTIPGDVGDADFILYTLDAAYEGNGWNVFGAFMGASVDPEGGTGDDSDSFGLVVQGGVFVTDQCELFARWDWTIADEELTSPELDPSDIHFLTVGFNCYISPNSHAAKVTGNVIWALTETSQVPPVIASLGGPYTPNTSAQILGDSDDGELSWALQFTLGF